ncbi:agamous-like MADS-box protein AGL29 [Actinidia eriantha]|uniref:agamous-like MADS-box protein AGL29 n=1 Tax=Actinidia eriantha TaxID=165200 RepID=UPI00258DB74B|nr:agamous-like MADS-box protein AGL29 [Actinidia eriantha]
MKMIANENARRITFSKRRQGLFKKASELSTLCGVDVAIVLFSLGGKAFSFGSPNVDSIVDRFLSHNGPSQPNEDANDTWPVVAYQEVTMRQLSQQYHELNKRLEAEKSQNRAPESRSFDSFINELGLDQLEELKRTMVELKKNVAQQLDKMFSDGSSKHALEQEKEEEIEEVLNTEKNDGDADDASTIPHDWLKL